jgi:polysaccharide biosynthesis transport protein
MEQASSKLSQNLSGDDLDLLEIFRLLARHWRLLAVLTGLAAGTTIFDHFLLPMYRSGSVIAIQTPDNSVAQAISARMTGAFGAAGPGMGEGQVPDKYFDLLQSFDFFMEVALEFEKRPELQSYRERILSSEGLKATIRRIVGPAIYSRFFRPGGEPALPVERVALTLSQWTKFARAGQNGVSILVRTPEPTLARVIANLVAATAVTFLTGNELRDINEAGNYLLQQLNQSEAEIRDNDRNIVDFKRSNRVFSIEGGAEFASRAGELKKNLEEVSIEIEQNEKLMDQLNAEFQKQERDLLGLRPGDKPLTKFGLARKIEDLRRENQFLVARKNSVERVLRAFLGSQNPQAEQKAFDLRKRMELGYSLFEELKKQLFQLDLQRVFVKNRVQFFEKARDFTVQRSSALGRKLLFALVVTLLLGGVGAYVWELMVPRLKTKEDLRDCGFSTLGGIPDLSDLRSVLVDRLGLLRKLWRKPAVPRDELNLDFHATVAFKHLRAKVLHLAETRKAEEGEGFLISVLSAQEGEGKSFVARSLATMIAALQGKTLLVDGDLRKRTLSRFYEGGRGLSPGFARLLLDRSGLEKVIRREVSPGLDFLSAGDPRDEPDDLQAEIGISALFAELRKRYSFVIIDTPPILLMPSSVSIAGKSDLPIVVASSGRTSRENLRAAYETLSYIRIPKIYGVMNRLRSAKRAYTTTDAYYRAEPEKTET